MISLRRRIRRDLTINAIGYNLCSSETIDPFGGVIDLNNRILQKISDDFYRDPVRALRLIRFKLLLNFDISSDIELENLSSVVFRGFIY